MIYNIHYDVCAFIISILTAVCVLTTKDIARRENRVFLGLVLNGLISAIFDIASAVADSYPHSVPYPVLSGLSFIFLMVHNSVAMLFYLYIHLTNGRQIRFNLNRPQPYMIPWFVSMVVLFLNPFLGWVYYFDENLVYRHGPMFFVLYGSALIYIIMATIDVIRYAKATPWKRKILLLAFVVSALITVFLQIAIPKLLIELFIQSLIYLGILVSIDDEDATYDLVTRVYNRKTFLEDTQVRLSSGLEFDIIILKLTNLDYYRSSMGIETMNEVTYEIAHWLDGLDNAAKVYDLESGVFVFRTETQDEVLTEALRDILNEQFQLDWIHDELAIQFNVQIAVVHIPGDVDTLEQIVNLIDRQYVSTGRTRILEANEFESFRREAEVEVAIRKAIENKLFKVYYQPIWDSGTGMIHSAEALIRLIDDELGYISPEEFIRIAEHNGTIIQIGEIVFEEVCRFIRDENIESLGMEFIEVNLSAVQCMQHDLADYIMGTIDRFGIDASQINLEITESVAVQNEEQLRRSMKQMRTRGISFSMDDFGTGYSNLHKVFSMGYDIVKIDKSILWAADEDFSARVLLESTIQMIKDMDCRIVVEGVETADHCNTLKHLGVDFCQGFFFSRALAEEEFIKYVSDYNKVSVENRLSANSL